MAFLELRLGLYVSRVWFFEKDGLGFDVMMVLYRELPAGAWTMKAFDSVDEKSVWQGRLEGEADEREAVQKMEPIVKDLSEMLRIEPDVTIIGSDDPAVFVERVRGKSWVNLRAEGPES